MYGAAVQHIHALEWVNGDGDSVEILPLACLRTFTDLMSAREDGQTYMLGIGAGNGQMPGAVAGSSSVLCVRFSMVLQSLLALKLCVQTVNQV